MKVVCVDDREREISHNGIPLVECELPLGWVVNGEVYTVIDQYLGAYEIAEKPIFYPKYKICGAWVASRFVPLEYFQAEFQVAEERTAQHGVNATTLAGVGIAQINEHPARI